MRHVERGRVRAAPRQAGIDGGAARGRNANLTNDGGIDDTPQPEVDIVLRPLGRLRGGDEAIHHRGLRRHVLAQDAFDDSRDVCPLRGIDVGQNLLFAERQGIPDLHDPRLVDATDADVFENLLVDLPHLRRLRDEIVAVKRCSK